MSVYVDANSRLHHDQERSLALNCPHCQAFSHITLINSACNLTRAQGPASHRRQG